MTAARKGSGARKPATRGAPAMSVKSAKSAKSARSTTAAATAAPAATSSPGPQEITRVQTGVRMEKRIVKVLKALAEYHDLTLGDLLEGVVLHAFEGKCAFGPDSLERIARLREVYELDLDAAASHRLREREPG